MIPCGNMSHVQSRLGQKCAEAGIISTRKMTRIESFEKENLSLTVQAGASLETVQKAALQAGTFLPVTLEDHGLRTIGSLVAEGAKGYEAYAFGSLKEYLLGVM